MCPDRPLLPSPNTPIGPFPSLSARPALPTTSFTANPITPPRLTHSNLGVSKYPSVIQRTFAIQPPGLQHLPRGSIQPVFSQPPRLSTSRLRLSMARRGARLKMLFIMPTSPDAEKCQGPGAWKPFLISRPRRTGDIRCWRRVAWSASRTPSGSA